MTKISREEVIRIAEMSKIEINSHEIDGMIKRLESVLSYAERVQEVAADIDGAFSCQKNVVRDDIAVAFDAEKVFASAPEKENNYFVVPKILEENS
jgi:aspartyl-tRNA(Asn)/glutamyl-tRNA(Gln) amidotransferase subunit C